MSLAFLAKKSWHTSNLRNVEKVWIAEQKHASEEKKLAELKKNMEEERQMQELRKLQAANGKKSATVERLDWMYQGPMASSSDPKTSEDYLLGKEFKAEETGSDARKLGDTAYGALALSKAAQPSNDAFSRLNEDPMMLIRSQQKRAQEDILKNPVKMKKIKGEVEKLLKDKKEKKKAKKKAKKESKKERKQSKKERSRRDRSSSMDSHDSDRGDIQAKPDDREERRRHKPPSPAREGEEHRSRKSEHRSRSAERSRRHDSSSRHRSRSRDRQREPVRDRSRGRESHRQGRESPRRSHRDRSRSGDRHRSGRNRRSSSRDSFGRTRGRSRSPESHRDRDRRERSPPSARSNDERKRRESPRRSRTPDRQRSRRESSPDSRRHRRSSSEDRRGRDSDRDEQSSSRKYVAKRPDDGGKYGLIRRDGAAECKEVDRSTLGPNSKFLEKARETKRQEEEELRRKLSKSSRGDSARTHEEMLKDAARMAEDAKAREAFLAKRAAEKREKLDEEEAKLGQDPHFIKQLQDAAYVKGDSTMEDRLRRNSHYIQKRAGASNFMSKD